MDTKTLEISPIILEADPETAVTQSGVLMDESVILPEELEVADLTDKTASLDLIAELKLKKFHKPQNVSLRKWTEAPEFSQKLEQIILKATEGARQATIAKSLSLDELEVKEWLESPVIRLEINYRRELAVGNDQRKQLELLYPKALEVMEEILDNPKAKEQLRLQAATYVSDQAIGKSKQDIEIKTTLLIDVMKKVESMQIPPRPLNKIDQLVLECIPTDVVTGQRGEV